MQDNKLLQLFSKLAGYQKARLRKFAQSPYHNQRADILRLLEYLHLEFKKQQPHYSKTAAWEYCYENQKNYKDSDMRALMTLSLRLIEQFLQVENLLEEDITQQYLYLAKNYQKMQLPTHAQHNLEQFEKQIYHQPTLQNSQYLRTCYEYQQAQHYFTETLKRNTNRNLQILTDSLEAQFIAERLRQACELLAHQTVYKIEYDYGMLPLLLSHIEQKKEQLLVQPAIALYYYYYQAATQDKAISEAFFESFIQLLLQIKQEFPIDEWRDLYKMAINYTIRKANTDSNRYYEQQMFILYQSGLQKGILLENKALSRFAYKNIISLSIRIGELDWATQFIQQYSNLLLPEFQKTYQQYALGKWSFAKKEYQQALQHLQQVEYEDIFLSLDVRVMQLKIYYELDEYAVLESFLQSFKMFLLRQKRKLSYHYNNYKNIIQITTKLLSIQSYSKSKINKLRNKIITSRSLTEREWLLAQLDKR